MVLTYWFHYIIWIFFLLLDRISWKEISRVSAFIKTNTSFVTVPFKDIFIWIRSVFLGACGLSLPAVSRGSLLSSCGPWASPCTDFSCWGVWALGCAGLRVRSAQAQQLWHTGLLAPGRVGSSKAGTEPVVACTGGQILDHRATREAGRSACSPLPLPQRRGGEGHLWNPGYREERGPVGACWTLLVTGISCVHLSLSWSCGSSWCSARPPWVPRRGHGCRCGGRPQGPPLHLT